MRAPGPPDAEASECGERRLLGCVVCVVCMRASRVCEIPAQLDYCVVCAYCNMCSTMCG